MKINDKEVNLRWCYACDEYKPLTSEYWCWGNKEHTRFRTKCRKCTNYDSMISNRIHRKEVNNMACKGKKRK